MSYVVWLLQTPMTDAAKATLGSYAVGMNIGTVGLCAAAIAVRRTTRRHWVCISGEPVQLLMKPFLTNTGFEIVE